MLAQRRGLVLGAERAALLQERHDLVDEAVEPARRQVGHEDEPVARVRCTKSSRSSATCAGVPMNDCRPVTSITRSRMPSCFDSATRATSPRSPAGSGNIRARPWMIDVDDTSGSLDRQRTVGVVGRQVAVPQLLEQQDRGLRAHLLAADAAGFLHRIAQGCRRARR